MRNENAKAEAMDRKGEIGFYLSIAAAMSALTAVYIMILAAPLLF